MSEDWAFHLLGSIPQMARLYSETDEGTLVPLLCHFLPLSLSEKFFRSWPSKVTDCAHFAIELWPFSTISVLHITQIFLHYALILSILTKPPILPLYHTTAFYAFVITKAIKERYRVDELVTRGKARPHHLLYSNCPPGPSYLWWRVDK